ARRKLGNVLKGRARGQGEPEGEALIYRHRVKDSPNPWKLQQRLDLRGEDQGAVANGVIERPNPHAVAGEEAAVEPLIPERQREVPIEHFQESRALLLVQVDNSLGIRLRAEPMPSGPQVSGELDVVEHFAVERQPDRLVLVGERLLSRGQ